MKENKNYAQFFNKIFLSNNNNNNKNRHTVLV